MQGDSRHGSQLRTAIVVSLALHGTLLLSALWLMDQRSQNRSVTPPATVRINLLYPPEVRESTSEPPDTAFREEAILSASGPQPPVDAAVANSPESLAETATKQTIEQTIESEAFPERQVDLPIQVNTPRTLLEKEVENPVLPIRDALTLRQTIRSINDREKADEVLRECSPAQRRNLLFDCPDSEESDFSALTSNPVFLSFNQPRIADQSRRAMGVMVGNQQQLRSNIETFSLDEVTNSYLLEELSQGIEVYSGSGNTRLERLTEQILRRDPGYQLAKRIMNPR